MKYRTIPSLIAAAIVLSGCGQQGSDAPAEDTAADEAAAPAAAAPAEIESFEIAPGLTARILRAGDGDAAAAGDSVEVHYTGWLYDAAAENNRGNKFDSSVDRGQRFQFPLGAGRVIKGWDQGVTGMQIGEVRELTIAPEMGYGDRGFPPVIPPASTLVFEVELFSATSLAETATE